MYLAVVEYGVSWSMVSLKKNNCLCRMRLWSVAVSDWLVTPELLVLKMAFRSEDDNLLGRFWSTRRTRQSKKTKQTNTKQNTKQKKKTNKTKQQQKQQQKPNPTKKQEKWRLYPRSKPVRSEMWDTNRPLKSYKRGKNNCQLLSWVSKFRPITKDFETFLSFDFFFLSKLKHHPCHRVCGIRILT